MKRFLIGFSTAIGMLVFLVVYFLRYKDRKEAARKVVSAESTDQIVKIGVGYDSKLFSEKEKMYADAIANMDKERIIARFRESFWRFC
ncbi:MAG: hypothetical protein HC888_02640 [Candidatus Competibacteraceae bacterium]|nr:hypothetical protein [Candidatus Competibacteraceae bacterium]